jgi:hypothetical protein
MQPNLSFSNSEHLGMISSEDVAIVMNKEASLELRRSVVNNEAPLINIIQRELRLAVLPSSVIQAIKVSNELFCLTILRKSK